MAKAKKKTAKKRMVKAEVKAKAKPEKKGKDMAGIAFVGFFFLGWVVALIFNRWDIGPLAGLATGFIAMLLVMMKY